MNKGNFFRRGSFDLIIVVFVFLAAVASSSVQIFDGVGKCYIGES